MSQFHGSISMVNASFSLYSDNLDLINQSSDSVAPNLFFSVDENKRGFCIAGVGISQDGGCAKLLATTDWGVIVETGNFSDISGHFAGFLFDEEYYILFTDPSGLRDIYILERDNRLYFTTNYHTLYKIEAPSLNPAALGGRWLLYNQMDNDSLFTNYTRLCSGERIVINRKTLSIQIETLHPFPNLNSHQEDEPGRKFINAIHSIFSLQKGTGHPLELSLSGGLDSRVLLSLLVKSKTPFSAHSFGNPDNPDVAMAKRLCESRGVKFINYTPEEITSENAIRDIKFQAQYSLLNHPATSPNNLPYYKKVVEGGSPIIIDGGFGELWRRQFFYKLSVMGQKAILNRDYAGIFPFLRHNKADIFFTDVLFEMEKGCIAAIEKVFHENPQPETMGMDNWIDLISLRTRLPNYYAQEQTMIDGVAIAIMPYIQNNVLDLLFSTPVELRKNSKLFKKIIIWMAPPLSMIPVVKGNVTVPFILGSLGARLYLRISAKTNRNLQNGEDPATKKLFLLKEYACDLASSGKLRNSGFLDKKKVAEILNFYDGETRKKEELSWLITFLAFMDGTKD